MFRHGAVGIYFYQEVEVTFVSWVERLVGIVKEEEE
jgi:hypothetical protein